MKPGTLDLRFRIAGVPVTVQPWFWLTAVLLGQNFVGPLLVFWVAVVFVSVLVHEMGHALASRAYGAPATVRLHGFGGETQPGWKLPKNQSIVMTLAGPAAGALLAVVAWLLTRIPMGILPGILRSALRMAVQANITWTVFNLLPIPPLDGGQVLLSVAGRRHYRAAVGVGIAAGVALALAAVAFGQLFLALFAGILTWQNVQRVRAVG